MTDSTSFREQFDRLTSTRPNLISKDVDNFIGETSNPDVKFGRHYLFYNREANTIAFEFFRKMFYSLFSLTIFNATVVNDNARSQSISFSPGSYSMTMKSLKRVVPYLNEFPLESPLHYRNIVKHLKDNFDSKTPIGDADIVIQEESAVYTSSSLYGLFGGPTRRPFHSTLNSTESESKKENHMEQIINCFVVPFFDYVLRPFKKLFVCPDEPEPAPAPHINEPPYDKYLKNSLVKSDILLYSRDNRVDSSEKLTHDDFVTFIEMKKTLKFSNFDPPEIINGIRYCKPNFNNLEFLGVSRPRGGLFDPFHKNFKKFQAWTSIYRQICLYAIQNDARYFILSDSITTVLLMVDMVNLKVLYDQQVDKDDEFNNLVTTFPGLDDWELNNRHSIILSKTIEFSKNNKDIREYFKKPETINGSGNSIDRITGFKEVTTVPFYFTVFNTQKDEVPIQTAICAILNAIASLPEQQRLNPDERDLLHDRLSKDINSSQNSSSKPPTSGTTVQEEGNTEKIKDAEDAHDKDKSQPPRKNPKTSKKSGNTGNADSSKESHKILTYNFGDEIFICDSLNGVRVNKQGMIGEAIQCSANHITKTFAIAKDDMVKCFPQLKMLNEGCFPDKFLLKVYDDQHIDEVFEWDDYYGTKTDLLRDVPEHYFAETTILRTLKIENRNKDSMKVPDLYGYGMIKFEPNDSPKAKPFKGLFILMEYIEPDKKQLKSILKDTDKDLKKKYYNQILAQLKLIHKSYIYHLDIAARNIVISENNAYLIDFSHSDFNVIYASTKDVDDLKNLFNFPDF